MRIRRSRSWGTMVLALAMGVLGCAEGESRESPSGGGEEAAAVGSRAGGDTPAASPREVAPAVPAGSRITVRLGESVSTATHSAGDAFAASVAADVTGNDGSILIRTGAPVHGVVAESRASEGPEDRAVLVLAVRKITVDGAPRTVAGSVVEADVESHERDSTTETVGKVAVGAAAGAIIGQVLGKDTESTLKGAGVGAVAGAIVAITTRDGHARAEEGTLLTVRLDQALTVDR